MCCRQPVAMARQATRIITLCKQSLARLSISFEIRITTLAGSICITYRSSEEQLKVVPNTITARPLLSGSCNLLTRQDLNSRRQSIAWYISSWSICKVQRRLLVLYILIHNTSSMLQNIYLVFIPVLNGVSEFHAILEWENLQGLVRAASVHQPVEQQ